LTSCGWRSTYDALSGASEHGHVSQGDRRGRDIVYLPALVVPWNTEPARRRDRATRPISGGIWEQEGGDGPRQLVDRWRRGVEGGAGACQTDRTTCGKIWHRRYVGPGTPTREWAAAKSPTAVYHNDNLSHVDPQIRVLTYHKSISVPRGRWHGRFGSQGRPRTPTCLIVGSLAF
jgi:hypothetical protein